MRYLLLFLMLPHNTLCSAKGYTDTLTARQIFDLQHNVPINTFASRKLLFTYATARENNADSAEKYIRYISPYELMWEGIDDKMVDWWLRSNPLSKEARHHFRARYTDALNNRSEQYRAFERMHNESVEVRARYAECRIADTCIALANDVFSVDTAHFRYLYNYVSKHGWPSIDDGGLYAEEIAVKDLGRVDYYLPKIKKMAAKGQASLNVYNVLYFWKGSKEKVAFRKWLDTVESVKYNVDFLMKGRVDGIIQTQLMGYISDSCPVKLYYVLEDAGEDQKARIDGVLAAKNSKDKTVIERFEEKLTEHCEATLKECNGCGNVFYFPSLSRRPTLWLYMVPVGDRERIKAEKEKALPKAEP